MNSTKVQEFPGDQLRFGFKNCRCTFTCVMNTNKILGFNLQGFRDTVLQKKQGHAHFCTLKSQAFHTASLSICLQKLWAWSASNNSNPRKEPQARALFTRKNRAITE